MSRAAQPNFPRFPKRRTLAVRYCSSIAASIKQRCTENEAIAFHDIKVGTSYTRFLIVVLGIYKQIRAQESSVLSDVDEDNFDRAFFTTKYEMSTLTFRNGCLLRSSYTRRCRHGAPERESSGRLICTHSDTGPKLTERELEATMDFCKNIFAPTNPRMHSEVGPLTYPGS
ncbi:hypothetical protein B0H19DRAFT_1125480 [Mycena capillaripes]|nr:hypothetical protein B0H19DRAFT_1125480 [Mycena capillaripes]